jgi:putative ABC transport system ATP-binding protein
MQPPGEGNPMTSLVQLDHVRRNFRLDHTTVRALNDVSLEIDHGEFLAVAGPSGSGKSTLLHIIGCLDHATSGDVRVDGTDVSSLRSEQVSALRREKIGFVFQTFNLIPVFTAEENVEYPLLLRRMPRAQRRACVREALAGVGLADRMRHRPDLLSGGERQRVAVARAIVHRPALVLADEPTANLDTSNATLLLDLMRKLNRELQITFLFSTHDPRLLDQVGRVIRLCDGKVVEREEPDRASHSAHAAASAGYHTEV